jgi:hypothetical protein
MRHSASAPKHDFGASAAVALADVLNPSSQSPARSTCVLGLAACDRLLACVAIRVDRACGCAPPNGLWRSRARALHVMKIGELIGLGAGAREIKGDEAHGSHSRDLTELSLWSHGQRGRRPARCDGRQYQLSIKQARRLWDHHKDARRKCVRRFPCGLSKISVYQCAINKCAHPKVRRLQRTDRRVGDRALSAAPVGRRSRESVAQAAKGGTACLSTVCLALASHSRA